MAAHPVRTTTSLKDSEGNMLLAAETAITTESEEFAADVAGRPDSRVENIKNLKAWDAE